MLGIIFALIAAASFAAGNIFGRLGLQYVRTSGGVLVSLGASLVLLLVLTLFFDLQALLAIPLAAAAWFAAAGVLNFPVGRFFKFLGIQHIGTSRATAISSGAPFFTVALAVFAMGEQLTVYVLLGTVLIGGGLFILAGEEA